MKLRSFIIAAALTVIPAIAFGDYLIKDGNGNLATVFSFIAGSKIVPAHAVVDSGGNEKGIQTNPFIVGIQTLNGSTIATGVGASNAQTQRVATSNDSNIIPWDGVNPWSIAPANTAPAANKTAVIVGLSPNGGDPCANPTIAKSSSSVGITSATTTQLVALSGATQVFVCGFTLSMPISSISDATFQFEYGTGSNCGTGTTTLTGALGSGEATVVYGATAAGGKFTAPAGKALCVLTAGAAVNLQGFVTYVQQ